MALLCVLVLVGSFQTVSGQTNRPLPPAPPAPTTASRVDSFRKLLAMTPDERNLELGRTEMGKPKYSARERQVLEGSIREFENLTPEQREARLLALQRQLEFRVMIRVPASNRVERLAQMSEADRAWQTERLAQWDNVPTDVQSMILTNLKVLSILFPDKATMPGRPVLDTRFLTQAQRDAMEKAIAEWNQLPEDKRQAISNHFCKYFTLDDKQRDGVLEPLSPQERRQMEKSLEKFNQLPRGQQVLCMSGFQKFASLSRQERQEFLRNAEQWQKMSPEDRQVWRQLVNRLRPPMPPTPPGMRPIGPALPPTPPIPTSAFRPSPPAFPVAGTNE